MKLGYHIIACAISAIGLASCDSYLDIKPKGMLIPETCSDYEYLLNNPQQTKLSDSYPNFLTDDVYLPYDDEFTDGVAGLDRSDANLYTFNSTVFTDGEQDGLWEYSYSRIYTYNVIANNVMESTEATDEHKRQVRAEALVGRALEYLTLVNAYGKHYDAATAATDPGVPLRLDDDMEAKDLKHATVQEVYDQIKADLDEAAPNLPEKPVDNAFRASRPVGYGILARMYLYMGDYAKALTNAELSLQANSTLIDLSQYEVVDPLQYFGRINVPDLGDNPENTYIRMAPATIGLSARVYGSDDLMALYDHERDARYRLFFTRSIGGYSLDYDLWAPYLNVNMALTTAEMYLIAAECAVRTGDTDKATTYLNTLRQHRYSPYEPFEASSAQALLKEILDERRRELPFNGCMRLIDLKRLNREPGFAKTITHEVDGTTYTLEPGSPKYVLPIPPNVLRFNPGMEPNVR